jgi:hypothetical protein
MPLATSLGLVLIAFGVDRLCTNRLSVVAYSMNWSTNGEVPWGGPLKTDEQGETVVVYRKVDGGYCFDAVFSPELKVRLIIVNKSTITVEYNVFSDFGHRRGYNLRTVAGLVFHEGDRVLRPGEGYGGYAVMGGSSSIDCGR